MMKLNFFLILLLSIVRNYCLCNENEQWTSEDEYSNYQVETLQKITDWDCWYKDYYLKVSRCPSKTLKSKEKIKCKQYKDCKRYCSSVYGIEQCRVRCRSKKTNLSKTIKVIYRVRKDGECKDSVICVYRTKCQGLWPKYIHQGCYYTGEFKLWWLKHKKEYAKPRIYGQSMIKPSGKIYHCIINNARFPLINPSLETTVQFRMSDNKELFYKIGQKWFRAKFIVGNLFFWIGKVWIPVRFSRKHHYWKIGDKWIRVIVLRNTVYSNINSSWIPLKVWFGEKYFKIGKRWLNLKLTNNKIIYKFGGKWIEIKILQNNFYNKINGVWYRVKLRKNFNLIKIGQSYRKIKSIHEIIYIKLGKRWFEFTVENKRYQIRFDKKWIEIIFDKSLVFLLIDNNKYEIRFKFYSVFIELNKKWFQIEFLNENLFLKTNKIWLNISIKGNHFYSEYNGKERKLIIDENKNIFYKSSLKDKLLSIEEKEIKSGNSFPIDQFIKKKNSFTMKYFSGYWLPFKIENGESFFFMSGKWLNLKNENDRLFYKYQEQWIEVCFIGKSEFNKIQGHWIEVKREENKLFYFDSKFWHQIQLTGKYISIKINDSWKSFAFVNGKKFIRLGNKFSEIKFHSENQNGFHLKIGGKWHNLKIENRNFFIEFNEKLTRVEFYSHRSMNILFDNNWLPVTFKNKKLYVRNGNCWLETIFKTNKIFVKIGDSLTEMKISENKDFQVKINGNFYKLIENNQIQYNKVILKISFINEKLHAFINGNWLRLRVDKESLMVKIIDSWIEAEIDENKQISVKVNNEKVILSFDNGILCETYENMKIPISIRFKQLYYNLDGKWIKIYLKDKLRYFKVNGNLVILERDFLRNKIRKYKLKLMLKCTLLSDNIKEFTNFGRSEFKGNIRRNKYGNLKYYQTIDMLKKPRQKSKQEII